MSKSPLDFFKALRETAKVLEEASKAAAKNRDPSGKSRAPLSTDEIAVRLFDTLANTLSSLKNASQVPPGSHAGRNPGQRHRSNQASHAAGYEELRGALAEASNKATRDYQRSQEVMIREIKGHLKRLKHDRAVLLRAPEAMPLTDPEKAAAYFRDVAATTIGLAESLEKTYADLESVYHAIAEKMAAAHTPSPAIEWQVRAQSERLRSLARARQHLGFVDRLAESLSVELNGFRAETEATDFRKAKAGFDPSLPLLRQFRKGMQLGAADLVQIRAMLDAEWTPQHAAFAQLPFKDMLQFARDWQQKGMSVEATDFVIAMFGRLTLFRALREMGLDKAEVLKPEPPAKPVKASDRPSGVELLNRIPGALPLTTNDQRDRLIDALVLASECAMPPGETRALGKALEKLSLVPVAQGDDARLRHYLQLVIRLEASALETIGKRLSENCQYSFKPVHLILFCQLREAAGIEAPSAALAAWDRHLANREAVRTELLGRASTLWQPLLAALIDSAGVSDHERYKTDRGILAPLSSMDAAARTVVLEEAEAIFKAFDETAFGMASKSDGWLSIEAPFGDPQRKRLRRLIDVLNMADAEREAYFAPPPEAPPLGRFADLVALLATQRNHFNTGPFGQAMRAMDFDAADQDVRSWLAAAPPSSLRDAMLQVDPATLRINEWSVFHRFSARPECAAIGLDWSGHVMCEVTKPDQGVPFEIGTYSREAFPEGEFGVGMLRAHASHPFPWQGRFDDVTMAMDVAGIAPLVLQLNDFRNQKRSDWSNELRAYHGAMNELCMAFVFLTVNRLVARELATNPPTRALPVIIGTHDFGYFDPIIHCAG